MEREKEGERFQRSLPLFFSSVSEARMRMEKSGSSSAREDFYSENIPERCFGTVSR
jgi:hypothetical protein